MRFQFTLHVQCNLLTHGVNVLCVLHLSNKLGGAYCVRAERVECIARAPCVPEMHCCARELFQCAIF